MQQITKKEFAITLLKENMPVKFVQDRMKLKFGTGMSNRDLTLLRKEVHKSIIFPSIDTYKQSTVDLYESLLGLQKILVNLTEINQLPEDFQEMYSEITFDILKYHDFYHKTRKELILKELPPELQKPKIIQSILKSLDEIENGDFVSPEDL